MGVTRTQIPFQTDTKKIFPPLFYTNLRTPHVLRYDPIMTLSRGPGPVYPSGSPSL